MKGYPYHTEYLKFLRTQTEGRKTDIVQVRSRQAHWILLGEIKWYNRWRQFCFYTEEGVILNKGCMGNIVNEIDRLTLERKGG